MSYDAVVCRLNDGRIITKYEDWYEEYRNGQSTECCHEDCMKILPIPPEFREELDCEPTG